MVAYPLGFGNILLCQYYHIMLEIFNESKILETQNDFCKYHALLILILTKVESLYGQSFSKILSWKCTSEADF